MVDLLRTVSLFSKDLNALNDLQSKGLFYNMK